MEARRHASLDSAEQRERAKDRARAERDRQYQQNRPHPPPAQVLDRLRQSLSAAAGDPALAQASVELAEAIRVLGHKHGIPALHHCHRLVEDLRELLDGITG